MRTLGCSIEEAWGEPLTASHPKDRKRKSKKGPCPSGHEIHLYDRPHDDDIMQVYESVRPHAAKRDADDEDEDAVPFPAAATDAAPMPPRPPAAVAAAAKSNNAMMFEFGSFVFAGLLLILVLEQFIQIGAGVRPPY
jgi:hypothetical protein